MVSAIFDHDAIELQNIVRNGSNDIDLPVATSSDFTNPKYWSLSKHNDSHSMKETMVSHFFKWQLTVISCINLELGTITERSPRENMKSHKT